MAKKNKDDRKESALDARGVLAITRALSDPRRMELFRRIAAGEKSTCMELRNCLAINPATMSHHMRQLEAAGLIETVRDGKFVRASVCRRIWKHYLAELKGLTA